MKKTIIDPLDRPFARAVAVETDDFTRVYLSGAVSSDPDGDLQEQTRGTLAALQGYLEELDGTMEDIVRLRVYLNETLDDDAYDMVNAAREEFFPDERHYPASTLIEVSNLVSDELRIEIDAEAIVPHTDWEVEVID
jgi:enamine deaminase RidA (YjgF/YER057c/UK114 family)